MSGHSIEHAIEETAKWKKFSFVMMPCVAVYAVIVGYKHFAHHHDHEQVLYPHMRKRDKEMPWALAGGSKCDLFDYDCAAKEKAAKAAAA